MQCHVTAMFCGGSPLICGAVLSFLSSFAIIWARESWWLYFNCDLTVVWLSVFCVSSSWRRGLLCGLQLWHFLVILTWLFLFVIWTVLYRFLLLLFLHKNIKGTNQHALTHSLISDFLIVLYLHFATWKNVSLSLYLNRLDWFLSIHKLWFLARMPGFFITIFSWMH